MHEETHLISKKKKKKFDLRIKSLTPKEIDQITINDRFKKPCLRLHHAIQSIIFKGPREKARNYKSDMKFHEILARNIGLMMPFNEEL